MSTGRKIRVKSVPDVKFCLVFQCETLSVPVMRRVLGDTLRGVGVCGGRVRGRVRIVRPETIDDLQAGEILVAEVTDVGYTAAFCYAAAVVTELGGPMSHAAVVAREFGVGAASWPGGPWPSGRAWAPSACAGLLTARRVAAA